MPEDKQFQNFREPKTCTLNRDPLLWEDWVGIHDQYTSFESTALRHKVQTSSCEDLTLSLIYVQLYKDRSFAL